MSQYRKILLIVDRSMTKTPAFCRAYAMAKSAGAELLLCLFDHHNAIRAAGLLNQEVAQLAKDSFLREKKERLQDIELDLCEEGMHVTSEVIWGTPLHEQIIAKVMDVKPDLVIKDVHFEPLLKRVLFTPMDWHLLRSCPCTLLLVNAHASKPPSRIIAAVDPTHSWHKAGALNERIMQAASELAADFGAKLHVVHVFEGLPVMASAEIASLPGYQNEIYEELRASATKQFTAFADRHGIVANNRHLLYGDPANAIAELIDNASTDLVVMGTIYRSGLDRLAMGSTAERVLTQLRCDVLAIKPEGFGARLPPRGTTATAQVTV